MLYYLFNYLDSLDVPGAGVFQYISFRAGMAAFLSLLITITFGKNLIHALRKKQVGEDIRDLGLEGQMQKKGTPTMGGIIIIAAILIPTLLFAKLDNVYVALLIITTCWLGLIGFLDDYIKVFKKNKKGLAKILADRAQFYARNGNKSAADQDVALAKSLDPSVKITGAPPAAAQNQTASNRTAGEEKKTQVIIKSNPNNAKPEETSSTKASPPPSQANTELLTAIAATYKDEKRYALVIGNSNYSKDIGILKNPLNDATDVATELRKSDFEVQLITNATYVQMREAMRKFQEKLTAGPRDQTVGLFYYAGHGVAYQDENYLVPIDADVKFEDDITRMCFPVQKMVLANMERTNSRMNIVILDACRNNPFPAQSRSLSSGLGEMKRARGSFIAYATSPGSVASDGTGRNGLYTQELIKALRRPGLTIEQVFKEVRMNVLRLSGEKQYTWDSSNIIGEFYFKLQ